MTVVGGHEAKTHLSQLLRRVASGEEIETTRPFGHDRGRFEVPDDFDAPLPADVLTDFE